LLDVFHAKVEINAQLKAPQSQFHVEKDITPLMVLINAMSALRDINVAYCKQTFQM